MKFRSIIIYCIFIIIIVTSFLLPTLLLMYRNMEYKVLIFDDGRRISVEAENVYLVTMIHDINNINTKSMVSASNKEELVTYNGDEFVNLKSEIVEELQKLVDNHIINELNITPNSIIEISYIENIFGEKNAEYTFFSIDLKIDGKEYEFSMEERTGKILNLFCDKDQLCTDISKEELLRNYIRYLDLNIIKDWNYEDKMLKSDKAKLIAVSVLSDNYSLIAINVMERVIDAPVQFYEE